MLLLLKDNQNTKHLCILLAVRTVVNVEAGGWKVRLPRKGWGGGGGGMGRRKVCKRREGGARGKENSDFRSILALAIL